MRIFTLRNCFGFRRMSLTWIIALMTLSILSMPWLQREECRRWPSVQNAVKCKNALLRWDLFYHLGGNGPWIPSRLEQATYGKELGPNCYIDQAHMLSRHAERYPTINAGKRHLALIAKLKRPDVELSGPLSFLNDWDYFTDPTTPAFENLTSTGPYAGTLQAFTTGQKLKKNYGHLVLAGRMTNFWTCDSPRDIETAHNFARGFFGEYWEEEGRAKLHVIPEAGFRGADTLTPGRTCRKYRNDQERGRDVGYTKLAEFQRVMAQSVAKRLSIAAGGFQFTALEIYGMMEMCGFDILVRGQSPWCKIFSQSDWKAFEYARDLLHYYRAGPGNPYAGSMGWLWLNATKEQLVNSSATGVYHSFVHDGDILPVLATMGILDEIAGDNHLPSNEVKWSRHWKTSDIVPMGGRLILEKIECGKRGDQSDESTSHVRLVINDGVFDLGSIIGTSSVPYSTSIEAFEAWVNQKGDTLEDFRKICGLSSDLPARISFLHQ